MRISIVIICLLSFMLFGCIADQKEHGVIQTDGAPQAIGPYSQAILAGDILYLAGQIGIDPATGQIVTGGIEAQTRQIMENVRAVLNKANYDFENVVQVQIFLKDMDTYSTVNSIYAEYFKKFPPARAVVEVSRLPKDALIEVLVTAKN